MILGERLKKVRKSLELTQQEFANRIGTTANVLTNYETGRRNPSASAFNNIGKTFNVSEAWLRNGEGEMFVQPSKEDELSAAVERLLSGKSSEFKRRLVVVLSKLDIKEWEILEKRLNEITARREEPDTHKQEQTQLDIAAELAELKRQNQELAAKVAAMEEEDIANGLWDGLSASPSASAGKFSPTAKK